MARQSTLAFARSLGGVGQPLQLLAQRNLGAWQQVGRSELTPARREPPKAELVGQHEVEQIVAERQHGGAGGESRRENERGGESRREDESVVPELDASRHCGGDPRRTSLLNAKTVCYGVLDVRDDVVVEQIEVLQHARFVSRAVASDLTPHSYFLLLSERPI
jgi:hypothetical protein